MANTQLIEMYVGFLVRGNKKSMCSGSATEVERSQKSAISRLKHRSNQLQTIFPKSKYNIHEEKKQKTNERSGELHGPNHHYPFVPGVLINIFILLELVLSLQA